MLARTAGSPSARGAASACPQLLKLRPAGAAVHACVTAGEKMAGEIERGHADSVDHSWSGKQIDVRRRAAGRSVERCPACRHAEQGCGRMLFEECAHVFVSTGEFVDRDVIVSGALLAGGPFPADE